MTNEAPIAYLYTGDDDSKELILDCNGEHARVLLDLGYTETPLFASRATDTALVEDLMSAPYEWHGPFGKEKHRIIPPALFDRILAVLEGKRT